MPIKGNIMTAINALIFVNIALWVGFAGLFIAFSKKQAQSEKNIHNILQQLDMQASSPKDSY